MRNQRIPTGLLAIIIAWTPAQPLFGQSADGGTGAAELGLELRRLGHTKRVLMIGAHPDDENTAILASLALGGGVDAAYLALTRGDGGQNVIGAELGPGLGLIRTEELLAARRLDGAQQFFTRAFDFGYSKTAEETLEHWPREAILADVVEVIRRFRPDIIIPCFTGTPRDGHGHHQVSGILAREAFDAAADPTAFPDQIARGLRPHRAQRVMNYRGVGERDVTLSVGSFDRLFGRSHYQIAMASRSLHRSQDMGVAQSPGPRDAALTIERGDFPAGALSPFAGLDTTLAQLASSAAAGPTVAGLLAGYEQAVTDAIAGYNPLRAETTADALVLALDQLDLAQRSVDEQRDNAAGSAPSGALAELAFRMAEERAQLETALWNAAGVVFDAESELARVTPGRSFELELRLWNGGSRAVTIDALDPLLPTGWLADAQEPAGTRQLEPGALESRRFLVTAPSDAHPTQAYFHERPREGDIYAWPEDSPVRTLPFGPAPVRARIVASVGSSPGLTRITDADAVRVEGAFGEVHEPVLVVPAMSVGITPSTTVMSVGDPAEMQRVVTVRVTSYAEEDVFGSVVISAPVDWRVVPAGAGTAPPPAASSMRVPAGGIAEMQFTVTPPADVAPGTYEFEASYQSDRGSYAQGFAIIDYPHIAPHALYGPAAVKAVAADVAIADGLTVGYIAGAGDQVADALRELGVAVTLLDSATLASGDLSGYDAIVSGIRAYEVRADARAHNDRLLDYVRAGGTYIVQYNQYTFARGDFAPYPLTIARPHGRVTDEHADVTLLDESHPVLSQPNRIGPADFEGWVQERGLYFADEFDTAYTPLLEMNDPGEDPLRGSLVVANIGAGHYVYTGLAFFRQLPAGVAGAYRLLANLVSWGADGVSDE